MTIVQEIRRKWKPRKPTSHKGDFGRIFILAGSRGLSGAAHLAGMGAVRAGAGLVTVGVPEAIYSIVARRELEVMVRPFPATAQGSLAYRALKAILRFLDTQDVLALGPGLSQASETQRLIRKLVEKNTRPLVLDADGLNAFCHHVPNLHRCGSRAVFTPHPGEFARMFGQRPTHALADRKKKVLAAAKNYRATIVLKGYRTVVADPSGKVYVNLTGNPGMASGGSGDVLTGVIAALLGQGFSPYDAARFGVYLHGLAGDLAQKKTGEVSLAARDILACLPDAIRKTRGC